MKIRYFLRILLYFYQDNKGGFAVMAGNYEQSMYKQLIEVMARLDAVENDLRDEKIEHKEDVDRLNQKINGLEQENQLLRDDNARLKSILNNNSSNTSNPPSTDSKGGKPANTYNGRKKTTRKAGGQKGHKGTTLTKAMVEEKLKSGKCRHSLRKIGKPNKKPYLTKYVVDLDVAPLITEIHIYADKKSHYHVPKEYRSDVIYGPNVKALAAALYSEGVMSNDRIAAFLNAASGNQLELSEGSVYHFCQSLAEKAEDSIAHLEEELLNQKVIATDATVVTVDKEQNYIRNFSSEETVLYCAMKKKTIEALRSIPFLKRFRGTLIHDHETALYHFGTEHGECNVHIIRYLRKSAEEAGHKWSSEMISLLCEMNNARKSLSAKEAAAFCPEEIEAYETRYKELIAKGREENKNTKHKYAKTDEKTLLNRLEKYMHNHLLFLRDFSVPFDDNMSERDLRKAKNREKMAGGFRKTKGHEMYCAILTIVETLKRRKMGIIENMKLLFMGTPAIF